MAIRIEITGDNAKSVMKEMFNLCNGVFSSYQNPPSAEETEAAGTALVNEPEHPEPKEQTAPAPQPEAKEEAAHPEEDKKGVPDNPFMGYAKDVVQCISEEQHTELKALSSKFLTADPVKHRPMLRKWFDDHNVKRLSELPAAKADEFKKWLEANMDAG